MTDTYGPRVETMRFDSDRNGSRSLTLDMTGNQNQGRLIAQPTDMPRDFRAQLIAWAVQGDESLLPIPMKEFARLQEVRAALDRMCKHEYTDGVIGKSKPICMTCGLENP